LDNIRRCRIRRAEMEKVKVKVVTAQGVTLPKYETEGSAGMDIRANITEPITLGSLERKLVPTGIKVSIPEGYEIQVRPRSGLALKHGISMANATGTIDSDYRGEIGVILINLSKDEYTIEPQERIGQMVLNKVEQIEFEVVTSLDETERGEGGFGHTGK
jgi:dUTP pyrophosphatase